MSEQLTRDAKLLWQQSYELIRPYFDEWRRIDHEAYPVEHFLKNLYMQRRELLQEITMRANSIEEAEYDEKIDKEMDALLDWIPELPKISPKSEALPMTYALFGIGLRAAGCSLPYSVDQEESLRQMIAHQAGAPGDPENRRRAIKGLQLRLEGWPFPAIARELYHFGESDSMRETHYESVTESLKKLVQSLKAVLTKFDGWDRVVEQCQRRGKQSS